MNEMLIIGGLVVAAVAMIIYALLPDKKDEKDHLLRRMSGKRSQSDDSPVSVRQKGSSSAAQQVMEKLAPFAMKPVMPTSDEEMSSLRQKLSQAGFRHESATRYFLASKTMAGVALAMGALSFALGGGYEPKVLFGLTTFAGGLGFMFPNLWLSLARSKRAEKIRNGLPDSLDLLVVSVESGLALDAGLQRVSEEMHHVHPELALEMQIATLENQMGVPRNEALGNMARRSDVQELSTLVAVITQAEKFGTSVAKALRNQADSLRVKRRQRAEERAQKTTVKLMLPLIMFIFPSIFVVLLGPAAMKIYETLMKDGPLS